MNGSNMQSAGLDYTYMPDYPKAYLKEYGEPLPSSYAIRWCMIATGVYRIFTKKDMKEFLFRLAITLNSMSLLEVWLMDGKLLKYKVKDLEYVLNIDEVMIHLGFQIYDYSKNFSDRDRYLSNVSEGIRDAIFIGALDGFSILTPKNLGENRMQISGNRYAPVITPGLLAKADFFARDLMKFITDETFTNRNPAILDKELELIERRERIKHLPVFEIEKIPENIIRQCVEMIFTPKDAAYYFGNPEDFDIMVKPLIYLAWLWANDFIISDGVTAYEKEGISIDYDDYTLDEGGFNLLQTIEGLNLEEMKPLLKGLMI
jgi:hypothetical protein